MKRISLFAICFGMLALVAGATIYPFFGGLTAVNGTAVTPSYYIGMVYPPAGIATIQNGGVVGTNAFVVNIQLSIDNTNFFTVKTYGPGTNSIASYSTNTAESFPTATTGLPIYIRGQAVTLGGTNVYLGGTYTQ